MKHCLQLRVFKRSLWVRSNRQYTKTLRSYQAYLDEIISEQRDAAALSFVQHPFSVISKSQYPTRRTCVLPIGRIQLGQLKQYLWHHVNTNILQVYIVARKFIALKIQTTR